MPIQLRWLSSLSASCFHAANAIHQGEAIADDSLSKALAKPTALLLKEISACGLPDERMLQTMAAIASQFENNRELASIAITKTRGRSETTDMQAGLLAGRIADLENAFRKAKPGIVEELALRGEPLKSQWDARGQGMLLHFERATDALLIAPNADIVLVFPATGGNGIAHLPFNTVRIEAVLANPCEQIPETVRLGWLLSQLQCDLPIFGERVRRERLPTLAALATLPPILNAAEHVELVRSDQDVFSVALTAWLPKKFNQGSPKRGGNLISLVEHIPRKSAPLVHRVASTRANDFRVNWLRRASTHEQPNFQEPIVL